MAGGAKVAIPASLNVGGLDLINPKTVKADSHRYDMALRLMRAYEAMGCWPTWTCSPYHAGHRPKFGQDVAWGESNAVAFCNSVLGRARTDMAISSISAAPSPAARPITASICRRGAWRPSSTPGSSDALKAADVFYPVLGSWYGAEIGSAIGVIDGLPRATRRKIAEGAGCRGRLQRCRRPVHVAVVTPRRPALPPLSATARPKKRSG